jgi:hypothetical protein
MTEQQARTTANAIMAAMAVGAVVIVLRSPSLRRLAWNLTKDYAKGPLPLLAAMTVRDAWERSAPRTGVSVR